MKRSFILLASLVASAALGVTIDTHTITQSMLLSSTAGSALNSGTSGFNTFFMSQSGDLGTSINKIPVIYTSTIHADNLGDIASRSINEFATAVQGSKADAALPATGGTAIGITIVSGSIYGVLPNFQQCVSAPTYSSNASAISGTWNSVNTRMGYCTGSTGSTYDLKLVFSNAALEAACSGTVTVTASIEYPESVFTQVNFRGNRRLMLDPGGVYESDIVPVEIPASTQFWVRTFWSGTAGQTLGSSQFVTNIGAIPGGATKGVDLADLTLTGTISNSTTSGYAPIAVLGRLPLGYPSVQIWGDSISDGTGDSVYPYGGFISRALGISSSQTFTFPHYRAGTSGETLMNLAAAKNRKVRMFGAHSKYAIVSIGINDFRNARTLSQAKSDFTSFVNALKLRGVKVYACTICPNTDSTDNWASLGNQTKHLNAPQEGYRTAYNDWIRAGADGLITGYFEIADIVETSRNSGFWKSDGTAQKWTQEGLHPSNYGHIQMSAGINVAVFNNN